MGLGFVVFDELFTPRPKVQSSPDREWWGGYELRFKLISRDKFQQLRDRLDRLRVNALTVGPKQERNFSVDLSMSLCKLFGVDICTLFGTADPLGTGPRQ